jgi:hypothetical protein
MKCKEIVKSWLLANGYNGLCLGGSCGCEIDDIAPCDGNFDCEPGYVVEAKDFTEEDKAEWGGYDYIVCVEKRE